MKDKQKIGNFSKRLWVSPTGRRCGWRVHSTHLPHWPGSVECGMTQVLGSVLSIWYPKSKCFKTTTSEDILRVSLVVNPTTINILTQRWHVNPSFFGSNDSFHPSKKGCFSVDYVCTPPLGRVTTQDQPHTWRFSNFANFVALSNTKQVAIWAKTFCSKRKQTVHLLCAPLFQMFQVLRGFQPQELQLNGNDILE